MNTPLRFAAVAALLLPSRHPRLRHAEVPEAIAAPDEKPVVNVGTRRGRPGLPVQGRCRRQARLAVPRTDRDLVVDGKTVGRHYAGPTWALVDGSEVMAKAAGRAPAHRQRHPATEARGEERAEGGKLAGVTTIQR